jgi:hypothetical protein
VRIDWRILIRPQHEEAFVTQAILHVDRARTRMPLVCNVISVVVWTVFVAICFTSWLLKTNDSSPDLQGVESVHAPQSNTSATNVSAAKRPDPYATESWDRPGRRF